MSCEEFYSEEYARSVNKITPEESKTVGYFLTGSELSYVFKLVALDTLEKKKKYESAKKVYEHTDKFFQALAQVYNQYTEELANEEVDS